MQVAHTPLFAQSAVATKLLVEALTYKSLSRLRQVLYYIIYYIYVCVFLYIHVLYVCGVLCAFLVEALTYKSLSRLRQAYKH